MNNIDPDLFDLATATFSIKQIEFSDSYEIYIVDCNALFTELTALKSDGKRDIRHVAFGVDSESPEELYSFSLQSKKGDCLLKFKTTTNCLFSRISPGKEGCLHLVCSDYTEIQNQLDSYNMQQIGYGKYIENFQGMAFQRMMKPELKSVFTAGAYELITGYGSEQAKNLMSWMKIVHPEDRERVSNIGLELYDKPGTIMELEYRIIRKDGHIRWIHSYDSHFISEDGKMEMVQGLIVDITDQKKQELELKKANNIIVEQNKKLEEMSMTDHLTGLSNRRAMQQFLEYLMADFTRTKEPFSILMIDLDDFKEINDRFGHDAGDVVLCGVSRIFQNSLRQIDFKSRWGGEEFLISLPRTDAEMGLSIAEKLLEKVRTSVFEHKNIDMKMTFSGGLATFDRKISIETLIKEADRALYKAKESGKNRICTV